MRAPATTTPMNRADLETFAAQYGFRIEPHAPMIPEPETPRGYWLYGPRGNKTLLLADADGFVSREAVTLWWDGVSYVTARINARRSAARAGRDFR